MPGFTIKVTPDEDTPAAPGGFDLGAEVRRESDPTVVAAIAAFAEITPADPTKATHVVVEFQNPTDGSQYVSAESWKNSQRAGIDISAGGLLSVSLLLGVGETYYVSSTNGCTVDRLIERPVV